MNKTKKIIVSLMTVFVLTLSVLALKNIVNNKISAENQEASAIEVTYIANEGFLISSKTKKILIDALFLDVIKNYHAPPKDVLEKMETAQPPFDQVALILATHNHDDHFNAQSVARCLKNNPKAVFLSTPQAVDDMEKNSKAFDSIRERIKSIKLDVLSSAEKSINGIDVTIIRTAHSGGRPEIQNYMYLIKMEGKKIFHEGDCDGELQDFENLGLEKKSIDIAFFHPWFFMDPDGLKIVKEYINPKQVVLMHIPIRLREDAVSKVAQIKEYYPNLVYLKEFMDKKIFK